jgi:hypothetical protein
MEPLKSLRYVIGSQVSTRLENLWVALQVCSSRKGVRLPLNTVANRDIKDKTPNHQTCPTTTTYIVATYTTMSSTVEYISSVGYINIMLHFCMLRIIGKGVSVTGQYLELNVGGRVGGLCGGKI